MKLELKHLASYLPYELKVLIKEDLFIEYNQFLEEEQYIEKGVYKLKGITNGTSYLESGVFLSSENENIGDCFTEIKYIKPILFPFSSLTKEITINGETFVPYDKIKEIYPNTPQFTDYIKGWMKYYGIMNSKCEYVCILKLFEWKLDVFGLIEEGLAEQVTEDFNPYK